jgi:tetratricopeptide (TPR) repeat protein
MSRSRLALLGFAVLLLTPTVLHACLWDYDTLKMERARFPTTLELITGKFLRHSPEFYQWRIEDRQRRLYTELDNLALYDDLAVAYHKLGRNDKAIETILLKEQKHPDLYETYANLGTFYIFVGEWEKSLEYIDKALAINPDAHFGRERYQKYLVEYVLTCRRAEGRCMSGAIGVSVVALPDRAFLTQAKLRLPLNPPEPVYTKNRKAGFYVFLSAKRYPTGDRAAAVKGVLGMMKFADHENPLLLEALGDILWDSHDMQDAKQLAARAYLKASYRVPDAAAKKGYRSLAEDAITLQKGPTDSLKLSDLEASFTAELQDADAWYAKLHEDERRWIREGKNPETEFDRLYTADPSVNSPDDNQTIETPGQHYFWVAVIAVSVVAVLFILAVALMIVMARRFWQKTATP